MSVTKGEVIDSFGWLEHQRILFLGSFLVGTVGVLILRSLGFGIITTSLFALSTMTLYMFSGVTKKFVIRPDILGDNLYYLGFLFTLVSMAYSLYSLGIKKSDINAILENFGLAISTTLYGLALRVFFNQTKSDLEGYDTAVRMSLTDAASSLIGEMSTLGRDIATLRLTFTQSINETIEAQKNSLNEISKINKHYISENSSAYRESITNLFQDITDKQNKFLKDGTDRQVQDLNKLNQYILNKQIELDRVFKNEFESLAQSMHQTLVDLTESSKQFASEAKKFAPTTSKFFKEIDKFSSNSEQINSNLISPMSSVADAVSESSQRLIEVSNSLSLFNQFINDISSTMPTILEEMNTKYKNTVNSQIQFYDLVKSNLNDSIVDLKVLGLENKKFIADQNSARKNEMHNYIESNSNFKNSIDEVMESLRNLNDQMIYLSKEIANIKATDNKINLNNIN